MHVVTCSAILMSMVVTKHTMIVIFVTAIFQWLLGALWYGLIFKKSWTALAGFSETNKPKNGAMTMVFSFIACLLLSYVLAHVIALREP
jgi:hypothetical protein